LTLRGVHEAFADVAQFVVHFRTSAATPRLQFVHQHRGCAPFAPIPTSAVRNTDGWVLNTGSTCSVHSVVRAS
jgi:hypothetical protein